MAIVQKSANEKKYFFFEEFETKECKNKRLAQSVIKDPENFDWDLIKDEFDIIHLLPVDFIVKYSDRLNYKLISGKFGLPLNFIHEHRDQLDWSEIDCSHFTQEFINDHIKYINWYNVSFCGNLTEEFIDKYKNKLDWYGISCNNLPLNILRRFKKRINWGVLLDFVKVNKKFIDEFIDYFPEEDFLESEEISERNKNYYKKLKGIN